MFNVRRAVRATARNVLTALLPLAYRMFYRGRPVRAAAGPGDPKRILVLNGAHIGDIVISTSILGILRSAYPNAEIGFVTGSWSQMVLKDHPDVDFIHRVDHWLLNRSEQKLVSKVRQYQKTLTLALPEIRAIEYDLALCLYTYNHADFMDVAWLAGIPVRLGFQRSLYASLATAVTEVPKNPFLTQSAVQAAVLGPLALDPAHFQKRLATLPESTDGAIREVCTLLDASRIKDAAYCVIHMGSGALNRELPPQFWREVAETLAKSSTLVFTGRGERETSNVAAAISGLANCINACGRLSWDGFVAAVRYADVVYGVESMAGHVAAAVGTPCVVAYTGTGGVACWRPESDKCTVFTNHLPCAPCANPRGCNDMSCLRSVSPQDLLGGGQEFRTQLFELNSITCTNHSG